jgi:SAM-dependent methyltransferase
MRWLGGGSACAGRRWTASLHRPRRATPGHEPAPVGAESCYAHDKERPHRPETMGVGQAVTLVTSIWPGVRPTTGRLPSMKWAAAWLFDRLRSGERLSYRCNVCEHWTSWARSRMTREGHSCGRCGSTVRQRAVTDAISQALYGQHLTVSAWQPKPSISALGFSDTGPHVVRLSQVTNYLNTWHHREPRRDLLDLNSFGPTRYDLIVCSEVLEHVQRPVEDAVDNLYRLLNSGGFLVLSCPTTTDVTVEHFPALRWSRIESDRRGRKLVATTVGGEEVIRRDLIFHGGPGSTLEMRLLGSESVHSMLKDVGFAEVTRLRDEQPGYGVVYEGVDEPSHRSDGHARGTQPGVWLARR